MFKLDDNFLRELGLGNLPVDEKNRMLAHIYEKLEMNVGMRLAEQMSNEQLDEFEGFIDRNDEAGALKWLETNFPNYKQVVADELEKLKGEIRQLAPQILAASQQDPVALGQPGATPGQGPSQPGQMPPQGAYQPPPQPQYQMQQPAPAQYAQPGAGAPQDFYGAAPAAGQAQQPAFDPGVYHPPAPAQPQYQPQPAPQPQFDAGAAAPPAYQPAPPPPPPQHDAAAGAQHHQGGTHHTQPHHGGQQGQHQGGAQHDQHGQGHTQHQQHDDQPPPAHHQ